MDFDLNATLNNTQATIYASDERTHPQATAAPPTSMKRSASPAPDTPLKKPKTHAALPDKVILTIADHLPFNDIPAFSLLDKRTYHLMEERRWAGRCTKQARNVCDLASWQQLIDDIERIQAEPGLRTEPFLVLSERLQWYLPEQQQAEAFEQLFAAVNRLPEQDPQIKNRMLLLRMSIAQRSRVHDAMAEQIRRDQENCWPELAELLGEANYERFWLQVPPPERYQALLSRLVHLDPSEQAKLIPLLADRLRLSGGDTLSAYMALLQQTLSLPASQQGASVGALAAATRDLPEAERVVRYAEIRQLALSLSDEQLGIALHRLPLGLTGLPPYGEQAHGLQLLEPALLRAPPAQRVQIALGLLRCSLELYDVLLSKQIWQRALQLLDGSSEADLLELFSKLGRTPAIDRLMPGIKQRDAVNEILVFVDRNRVTESTRAMMFAHMPVLRPAMTPEERLQIALGLMRYSSQLDDVRSKQVWQLMLRLFDGGFATEILEVLSRARQERVTTTMSDQKWQDAVSEILAFTRRSWITDSSRATLYAHIPWLRNPNLERPRQQRLEIRSNGNMCRNVP
ncbi:hypothetical protein IHE31_10405 [Mycetohabitans rhizoxinica]|uniref:hypothetical protein n=1 Tax=Mycetohabitans rhizoxinica TaxID=412963 RepID=UPI0030CB5048